MKWIEILKILAPAILTAANPAAAKYIPIIVGGIHLAEETQRPGKQKRALGREAVELAANTANVIAKSERIPVADAVSAYDESVDAIVSVVNLVKRNAALSPEAQPSPAS